MTNFPMIVAILAGVVLVVWQLMRAKTHPKRRWVSGSNPDWENLFQSQSNATLPDWLAMLQYQLMQQSQQDLHQQEVEQFWMMQEPTNDLPTVSDSPWDM